MHRILGRLSVALGASLFAASIANAASPLTTFQTYTNQNIVPNGQGHITGSTMNTALNNIVPIFTSMGTWDSNGNFTLSSSALPLPTAITLGGVKASTGLTHQFSRGIDTTGASVFAQPSFLDLTSVPTISVLAHQFLTGFNGTSYTQAQPTASDISGLAPSAPTDTTNASNITSGTLNGARLPNPTVYVLGGVKSATAGSHQFQTGIDTTGTPLFAQPAAADISGLAPSATTDTTNASNITSGTLAGARLPNPQSSVLGGVLAASGATHQFQTGINTSGSPVFAQPSASDVSGLAASATTDTTNASNISSGTLPGARLNGTDASGANVTVSATTNSLANWLPLFLQNSGGTMTGSLIGTNGYYGASKSSGSYGWLETLRPFSLSIGQFDSVSTIGKIGGVFGSRTSDDAGSAGDQGTIGVEAIVDNDRTSPIMFAFAAYLEARREAGAGTTHAIEVDSVNLGTVVDVLPNTLTNTGITSGYWDGCGAGVVGAVQCSAAFVILNNGAAFRKGIVIGSTAIDGATATSGEGVAVALSRGHRVNWYDQVGNVLGYMLADGTNTGNPTGLKVDNSGALFDNAGEYPIFRINNTTSSVNYPYVTSSVTGSGVTFGAAGSDANVNVILAPQGGGVIIANKLVQLPGTTVASLPTCSAAIKGGIEYVSDASSPTYNSTLTGGGSTVTMAFCNVSNWTAH